MDLADELAAQNFRWVFLMNAHGAPSHSRALLDACDYYKDAYGLNMVHLFGLMPVAQWFQDAQQRWSEQERRENGFLVHADMLETSWTLFLRPSAVSPDYASAPSITTSTMTAILESAAKPGWAGYVGAPKLAKASLGAQAVKDLAERINNLSLGVLDGNDVRSISRFTDMVKDDPDQKRVDAAAGRSDAELEKKQTDWLKKHSRY
jgi:creatinine amidohydrolase/Fe(II)-dependent formamide hydrolase-like protein